MGKAARGGLLVFQHVPGDAAQLALLPFHFAQQLGGQAHRQHRAEQRQREECGQEHGGLFHQALGTLVDLILRGDASPVTGLDELGDHGNECLVIAEQILRRKCFGFCNRQQAPRFGRECRGSLPELIVEPPLGSLGALRGDAVDVGVRLVQLGQDLGGIERIRVARQDGEDFAQAGLLPVYLFQQAVGGLLLLDQARGVLLDGVDIADADEGAGQQQEDDQAESGNQYAQQAAVRDPAGRRR